MLASSPRTIKRDLRLARAWLRKTSGSRLPDHGQRDLGGVVGSKGVTSEIVRGKRSISKTQAKALAEFFHVSPELFI